MAEYLSLNLLEGKQLYVELWETTPNRAPRLIWKNVERLPGQAVPSSHATHSHPTQLSPPLMPTQQEVMAQQMASMRLTRDQPAQAYQPAYQTSYLQQSGMQQIPPSTMSGSTTSTYERVAPPLQVPRTVAAYTIPPATTIRGPRYAIRSSGIPTNVDRGAVKIEYRGVFVSNLSYDVHDKDINKLFSAYGEITKMDHKRETKVNSNGKTVSRSKGSAVITYATSDQAQKAIDKLDGCTWNERTLALRRDKEPTPVNPPRRTRRTPTDGGPLIVDGSTCGD